METLDYSVRKATSLLGRTIREIWIDGDEQRYLVFKTDDGEVAWFADGDCCSESWFYHVLGVDALLGHVVTEVREVAANQDCTDGYSRQDVDLLYGIRLTTTGGYADIEFRNSSNGYYNGELVVMDGCPPDVRLIPVTSDYTAQLGDQGGKG